MAQRTYRDGSGTTWRVWDVIPGRVSVPGEAVLLPEEVAGGWLAFDSDEERRRFYPLPPQWELLRDWQLETLRRAAVRVSKPDS